MSDRLPRNPHPKPRRERTGRLRTDLHVRHLMQLISTGNYLSGVTSHELAKEWELSNAQVEHLASEAARVLRFSAFASELVLTTLEGTLQTIRYMAVNGDKKAGIKPDLKAAVMAVQTHLGLIGVLKEHAKVSQGGATGVKVQVQVQYPDGVGPLPSLVDAAQPGDGAVD